LEKEASGKCGSGVRKKTRQRFRLLFRDKTKHKAAQLQKKIEKGR